MTSEQLKDRFWKLYGKRPAFSELEQFRRAFGSGTSYFITEEDREAIRKKRKPSRGSWNHRDARPAGPRVEFEPDEEDAELYEE